MPNLPQIIDGQISNKIQGSENKALNNSLLAGMDGAPPSVFIGKEEARFNQQIRPAAPSVEYARLSIDGVPRVAITITPVDHDELGHHITGSGQKYIIYRDKAKLTELMAGSSLYFEDQGLNSNGVYSYQVQVVDANGNSNCSEQFLISPKDNTIPNVPLTPTVITDGVRTDSYGEVCHGLLEYVQNNDHDFAYMKVYVKPFEVGDGDYAEALILKSGYSINQATGKWYAPIKGLVRGKRYSLKLQAFDFSDNYSDFSDEVHFTAGDFIPPNPVQSVSAVDISTNIATLTKVSWRRPEPNSYGSWDIAKYEVYKGHSNSGIAGFAKIGEAPYTDKPYGSIFVDSGILLSGKNYLYGVRAADASNNLSAFSFSNTISPAAAFDSPVITITHIDGDLDVPMKIEWDADLIALTSSTGFIYDSYRLDFHRTSDDQLIYVHTPRWSVPGAVSKYPLDIFARSGHNVCYLLDMPFDDTIQLGDTGNYYVSIIAGTKNDSNFLNQQMLYSKLLGKETFTYNPVPVTLSGLVGVFDGTTNKVNARWSRPIQYTAQTAASANLYGKILGYEVKFFDTNSGQNWNSGVSMYRQTKSPQNYPYGLFLDCPSNTAPDDDTTYYYGVKAIADRERTPWFVGLWSFYGQKDVEEYYYSQDYTPIPVTVEGTLKQPTSCIATGDKQKLNLLWSGTTATRLKEYKLYISDVSEADLNTPSEAQMAWRGKANQIVINKMPDGSQLSAAPKTYYFKLRPVDFREAPGADSVVFTGTTVDAVGPSIDTTTTVPALLPYAIINSATLRVNWMTTDETSNLSEVWGRVTRAGYASGDWQKTTGLSGGLNSGYFVFSGLVTDTWSYEIRALDEAANAGVMSKVFEVDTVAATEPDSIVATQVSKDGVSLALNYSSLPNHFKEFNVYYRVNSGVWNYLSNRTSVAFTETVPGNGNVGFGVMASKLHSAGLNSPYPPTVFSNEVSIDSLAPEFNITGFSSDITSDRLIMGATDAERATFEVTMSGYDSGVGFESETDCVRYNFDPWVSSSWVTLDSGIFLDVTKQYLSGIWRREAIPDGLHSLTLQSWDKVSNFATSNTYSLEVDTAAPANGAKPTVNVNGRTIEVILSDTKAVNFKHFEYYYSVDNWSTPVLFKETADAKTSYTFAADISTQVRVKAKQVKRNLKTSDIANSTSSDPFWIDITPPVLAITAVSDINQYGYTHNSGVNVTFSATDVGGSLVSGYQYSLNGGAWTAATSPQSVALNPAVQSGQTIQIKATDNAGNSSVVPISFKYDSIPPITVPTFAALFQSKIRWTWGTATDDNSGVAGYEVRPTDADWGTPGYVYKGEMNEFTTTPVNSGNVTYFAKAFDYADNYSTSAATVTATNVKPHAVGTISTQSELNGVQFSWDEVTTDENDLATDDIWGYSVRTKIGAGAWSTYSGITTNSFFRSKNAAERVQASVTNYIEVLTQNKWGQLSTNSGVANAEPIKVEFANMGNNPMQFEVWVNSGLGVQTQADNPLFLNLVDGDFVD